MKNRRGSAQKSPTQPSPCWRCVGLGIDTLSPDGGGGASAGFPTHHAVLGADRYILENLRLAGDVPPRGARANVAPLNVRGAPEAPARVWAVVPVPSPCEPCDEREGPTMT